MPTFNQITAGQFCRELACGLEALPDLLDSWGLTEQDYKDLRKNPWFQREIIQAVADVKDMGPNAAFITKCRAIVDETVEVPLQIIRDPKVDPRVRIDAFKHMSDLARLTPSKNEENNKATGPSVIFNFGSGLKGIPETLSIIPEQEKPCQTPMIETKTISPPPL